MKRKDHTVAAHKSFLMFLLLIVFFAFTACNTKGNNSERLSSSTMPDFQHMFKYDGARVPTQKSDSGYYNIVSDHIIFTDAETLDSTPLCNKTDCLHTGDFPDCNAKISDMESSFDNFQIYRDKMYYLATKYNENTDEVSTILKSTSLDGTQSDTAMEFKDKFICDWFIYDGYFYYQTSASISEENSETQAGNYYRVSLSDKREEEFIDFSKLDGIYGASGTLRNIYDGYMYVTINGYENKADYEKIIKGEKIDGEISTVRKIGRYSLSDGSYTTIDPYKNDYEFVGFSDEKLVGTDTVNDKKKVCISELDGTNPQTVTEINNTYRVFCDNSYIYVYNQSAIDESTDDKIISVYDKNGEKKSDVTVPSEVSDVMYAITFGDDYMWFQKSEDSGAQVLCCIEKFDLLNSGKELTYKEVYRYE